VHTEAPQKSQKLTSLSTSASASWS